MNEPFLTSRPPDKPETFPAGVKRLLPLLFLVSLAIPASVIAGNLRLARRERARAARAARLERNESPPRPAEPTLAAGVRGTSLPYGSPAPASLPAARTPGGTPLAIGDVAGRFEIRQGEGGAILEIRADGTASMIQSGELDNTTSRLLVRVSEGRLVFESLDVDDTPSGRTCAALPVWRKGVLTLLSADPREGGAGPRDFCNFVNWGGAPWWNAAPGTEFFFSRKIGPGADALPDEIASLIRTEPLRCRVLATLPHARARIDAGRLRGVFPGMRLRLLGVPEGGDWAAVAEAGESESVIELQDNRDSAFAKGLEVVCEAKGKE